MKWVFGIIGLIVTVLIATLVYVYLNLGSLIKLGVETYVPPIIGVPVTVDSVSLMPFEGSGSINGFTIGNPKAYAQSTAIGMNKLAISLDPRSLTQDTIVIKQVSLDAPEINFIQLDKSRSNFTDILANINKAQASQTSSPTEPDSETTATPKLIIDQVDITNVKITATSPLLPDQTILVPIPDLHLTGLGRKTNGATPEQLAKEIGEALLNQIKTALLNSDIYKQQIQQKLQAKLDAEKQRAKQRVQEEQKKLEQKLSDKLSDELGDSADVLKGLFK